jgi:ADP-heptose:LPS heptosyltransferase
MRRRRVLIARQDNQGDVLLAGPAVRAVCAGARSVSLLCGPRGEAAARLLPGIDELLVWRAPWIEPEPDPVDRQGTHVFIDELAGRDFDQALILTSFHQSPLPLALLLRMGGVPEIAATSVDYPGSLLDVRHRIDDDVHEVERSLSLVAMLGYELPPDDDGRLSIRRPAELPFAAEALAPYVVVHPGASASARAWEPERHAALVDALVAAGRNVVVTGGPDERDLTARVAGPPRAEVLDLGGRTTLAELVEVIAAATALVVGNTGPAHVAAATATPVVSIYAPTVPAVRWRPWQVPHELLYMDVPCAGCRARECPIPGHPCIGEIGVHDVLAAVERLAPLGEAVPA